MGAACLLASTFCTTNILQNAHAAMLEEPAYGNYFVSDYDTRNEAITAAEELNKEIYGEGVVLLKNESDALPLGNAAKISLFGKNSNSLLTGGSGSGAGGGGSVTQLVQALNNEGFQLNPTLVNFYADNNASGSGRGSAPGNGNVTPGYNTGETPKEKYTDTIKSSFASYNDAAIVVISRISGEGFDLPRTMKWNGTTYSSWGTDATQLVPGARSVDDHYLQLDQNEADLIQMCGEHFDKVIVLFNTGSQFETGFLDDPGHYAYHPNTKAALWIGYPGGTGLTALAKVLKGEINPSGKTVDTWARDFKLDPVWMNFANNMMEGNSSLKGNQYENRPASGGNGGGGYVSNYVTYTEDIYIGYRYYETRGYDEGTSAFNSSPEGENLIHGTTTTDWANWYNAHVVYPFGYGLSYTTFSQTLKSHTVEDGVVKVSVTVENTGSVAGKDVVQLYYTAPYTKNGIEKAHVVLSAFEKTKLLEAGEEQTLELTFDVRDMASYDWNDANNNSFKGYELEAGTYTIKLMSDSHTVISSFTYDETEGKTYATDAVTGNTVENRFDEVSKYITDDIHSHYLSRSDWEETWPETNYKVTASEYVENGLKEWEVSGGAQTRSPEADEDMPYYAEEMPTTGESHDLTLFDLIGVDYDDPQWELFLDQLTVKQYYDLAMGGSYGSGQNYADLGISRVPNADGPAGYIYGAPSGTYMLWCSETVLASTWNKELAYEKGLSMGNQALWGNGAAQSRIGGWYAPAVNIHRSPFSGRNFEYYSEDGYLTGVLAAYQVQGAQSKGLFAYVKHFAVNDQESNRCGLLTWLSEQSMREIYLKPFEICVKVGETLGIMSSLNRIGYTWAGGSYELLTEILRNEWGFRGCVVTDSYMGDTSNLSNADMMIRAGGNLALGSASLKYNYGTPETATATTVTALRNAAHSILYAHANSCAMNTGSTPVTPKPIKTFTSETLQMGVTGAMYTASIANATANKELNPDANDSDIIYTLAEGSRLPDGLSLSVNGIITGTPNEEVNNFRFTVVATLDDYSRTADFIISIVNANGSIVYEAETELGVIIIGKEYSVSVATAKIYKPDATPEEIEAFPAISYELKDASLLPEGLTLSKDGTVSGTPTKEAENYRFTVVASAIGYRDVELTFTFSVLYDLTFEGGVLKDGKFGANYVDRISPATAENAVTYELKSGSSLPNGLSFTADGYITGTPRETVTDFTFTVIAKSPFSVVREADYKITIGLAFNDISLPDGQELAEYSTRVDTAQGAGNVTYTLKEGTSLPEGLTLSEDGVLSGTPTKAGVYNFTVVASADGKLSDEISLTLYIANADYSVNNSGCGGVINMTSLWIILPLLGAAVIVTTLAGRKRREDRE